MGEKMPSVSLPYTVVARKVTKTRTYQLLKFLLPKKAANIRRKTFTRILHETNALGLIEWWERGSIINKPKWEFYCILVSENRHDRNGLMSQCYGQGDQKLKWQENSE